MESTTTTTSAGEAGAASSKNLLDSVDYAIVGVSMFLTLIGVPAEAYAYGCQMLMHIAAQILFFPIYTHVLVPVYVALDSSSMYTFFQMRYNKLLWKFCAASGVFDMLMSISIAVFAASNILNRATGLGMWTCAIVIVTTCLLYTAIGGMKAVIWTDFFQGIIVMATMALIVVVGTMRTGGFSRILEKNVQSGRVELFNFSTDVTTRHTFWSAFFGQFFMIIVFRIGNQASVQRFLTASDLGTARRATFLGMTLQSLLFVLLTYVGFMIFAAYSGCDPVTNRGMSQNQLLPSFVMSLFQQYTAFSGIFVTAVVAALLSTVSSLLNALSAITLQDFCARTLKKCSESRKIVFCQVLVFVYGTLSLLGIFVIQSFDNVLQAGMILFSVVSTSVIALVLFGTFFPQVNAKAATIAEFVGMSLCLWLAVGNMMYGNRHRMKAMSSIDCDVGPTMWSSNATAAANVTVKASPMQNDFSVFDVSFTWYSAITFVSITLLTFVLTFVLGPNKHVQHNDIVPRSVRRLHLSMSKRLRRFLLCDIYDDDLNLRNANQMQVLLVKNVERSRELPDVEKHSTQTTTEC